MPALRRAYAEAKALSPEEAVKDSPLRPGAGVAALPRFVTVPEAEDGARAGDVLASLNAEGYWRAPLGYNSHPFTKPSTAAVAPGDFSQTHVGDRTDTSPYPDPGLEGISVEAYIRNMGVLIRALDRARGDQGATQ